MGLRQQETMAKAGKTAPVGKVPAMVKSTNSVAAKRDALKKIHMLMGSIKYKQEEAKQLEDAKRMEMTQLVELMTTLNLDTEEYGEFRATKYASRSPRVDPKKLISRGVALDVIEACTDNNPYVTVKITRLKGEEEE